MQPFTNKELYIMNGGQKLYIYKDGFGDIYNATAEEETQWTKEVVETALNKIATEENAVTLQLAIDNLKYHKYESLENLLLKSIINTSPDRQIVFTSALWNSKNFDSRFKIIFPILQQQKAQCLANVFEGINDFKNHVAAKYFLIYCLEGDDDALIEKAQRTLSIWAYSGLPELRENKLLAALQYENKKQPDFVTAIERMKQILNIIN